MAGDRVSDSLSGAGRFRLGTRNRSFRDSLGPDDKSDILSFNLRKSSTVNLSVNRIRENVNLSVFQIKGNERRVLRRLGDRPFFEIRRRDLRRFFEQVGQSNNRGRRSESLSENLEAGKYFIHLSYGQRRGQGTDYRLTGNATPLPSTNTGGSGSGGSGVGSAADVASWVRQLGSSQNDYAYSVKTDSAGNVYVAGTTEGTLPGLTSSGGRDNVVAKYNASGTLLWRRQFDVFGDSETIFDIEVDAQGNYYVGGITTNVTSSSGLGLGSVVDGFIAKYNSSGVRLWRQKIVADAGLDERADSVADLALAADGSVYVTGFLDALPDLGIPGVPTDDSEAFVAKYDGNTGVRDWFTSVDFGGSTAASGIVVRGNSIYITGITNADLTTDLDNPFSDGDAFVAKFTDTGSSVTPVWNQTLASVDDERDYARGIALDVSGNVYITGDTEGTMPGNTALGNSDGFVAKYDPNGVRQWVRQVGTSSDEQSQAIAVSNSGVIYVVGETSGTLGTPNTTPNAGGTDSWIMAFNSAGNLFQSKQLGTPQDDEPYSITVDSLNRPYLVGQTRGSFQSGVPNAGLYDIWIYKNPSLT